MQIDDYMLHHSSASSFAVHENPSNEEPTFHAGDSGELSTPDLPPSQLNPDSIRDLSPPKINGDEHILSIHIPEGGTPPLLTDTGQEIGAVNTSQENKPAVLSSYNSPLLHFDASLENLQNTTAFGGEQPGTVVPKFNDIPISNKAQQIDSCGKPGALRTDVYQDWNIEDSVLGEKCKRKEAGGSASHILQPFKPFFNATRDFGISSSPQWNTNPVIQVDLAGRLTEATRRSLEYTQMQMMTTVGGREQFPPLLSQVPASTMTTHASPGGHVKCFDSLVGISTQCEEAEQSGILDMDQDTNAYEEKQAVNVSDFLLLSPQIPADPSTMVQIGQLSRTPLNFALQPISNSYQTFGKELNKKDKVSGVDGGTIEEELEKALLAAQEQMNRCQTDPTSVRNADNLSKRRLSASMYAESSVKNRSPDFVPSKLLQTCHREASRSDAVEERVPSSDNAHILTGNWEIGLRYDSNANSNLSALCPPQDANLTLNTIQSGSQCSNAPEISNFNSPTTQNTELKEFGNAESSKSPKTKTSPANCTKSSKNEKKKLSIQERLQKKRIRAVRNRQSAEKSRRRRKAYGNMMESNLGVLRIITTQFKTSMVRCLEYMSNLQRDARERSSTHLEESKTPLLDSMIEAMLKMTEKCPRTFRSKAEVEPNIESNLPGRKKCISSI